MDLAILKLHTQEAYKKIEDEKIQKILEAGRWPPTEVNAQTQRVPVRNTPESLKKVREFSSFDHDPKDVDLAEECNDKVQGKLNFYYGSPLVLFVTYDKNTCWINPQSGKSSGATDATIVATHMMLKRQGHEEQTGQIKITPAFNLPCSYVIHTADRIIQGWLTKKDKELLAYCYRSCLELADRNNPKSIAFCCISTGEFHFPNDKAARTAIQTVKGCKVQTHSEIEVIFNVFKETDYNI